MKIYYINIVALGLVFLSSCGGSENVSEACFDSTGDGIITEESVASCEESVDNFENESYDNVKYNSFKNVSTDPVSTFSIDVDKTSYANIRRMIQDDIIPHEGAVRIEEMINYFEYNYPFHEKNHPIQVMSQVTQTPWEENHHMIRIGIQGKPIEKEHRKRANLVFLVDVSGSMSDRNKLQLFQNSIGFLIKNLNEEDKVSIVSYSGKTAIELKGEDGNEHEAILEVFESLRTGGSTNGESGIQLAYEMAEKYFIKNGNNRIVLVTDGDFNLGVSSTEELVALIEEKRKSQVYLSVCGLGSGNYHDAEMEALSNSGNGNYFYLDDMSEAQKVFERDFLKNTEVVANDVKIQIEFNPLKISSYKLLGYENRVMSNEDFENDQKDAGELGAGQQVTALYEVIFSNNEEEKLRYQEEKKAFAEELAFVKIRYKDGLGKESEEMSIPVLDKVENSREMDFVSAVALFGMKLKNDPLVSDNTYDDVLKLLPTEGNEEQMELRQLVKKMKLLNGK